MLSSDSEQIARLETLRQHHRLPERQAEAFSADCIHRACSIADQGYIASPYALECAIAGERARSVRNSLRVAQPRAQSRKFAQAVLQAAGPDRATPAPRRPARGSRRWHNPGNGRPSTLPCDRSRARRESGAGRHSAAVVSRPASRPAQRRTREFEPSAPTIQRARTAILPKMNSVWRNARHRASATANQRLTAPRVRSSRRCSTVRRTANPEPPPGNGASADRCRCSESERHEMDRPLTGT